jgi:hypothetical protein
VAKGTVGHGSCPQVVGSVTSGDRRYDDREVGLILKRVAELHESEGDKGDARAMTRGEIEQVVHELGISKALVSRATSELAAQDVRNRPVWWLGGKTDLMFEEVVDGHVDDAALTPMIEVLRRTLGDPGELKHEAGARIWSTAARLCAWKSACREKRAGSWWSARSSPASSGSS